MFLLYIYIYTHTYIHTYSVPSLAMWMLARRKVFALAMMEMLRCNQNKCMPLNMNCRVDGMYVNVYTLITSHNSNVLIRLW